jgi:trans-aconitate methyltransferase
LDQSPLSENPYLKFSRVPEPELMEDAQQVEAYMCADFSTAHSSIIQHLTNELPYRFSPETILDLGAGPGDLTARLHSKFPSSLITALDGSHRMLEKNRIRMTTEFPNAKMHWENILLQNFFPETSFELIFSNSLLHHLTEPYDFWSAIQRASDQNTFIFICDLIRPRSFKLAETFVNLYAKNESEVLRQDFYNSLLAAYTIDEVEIMVRDIRMDHKLKIDQITDRHWICYSKILN